MMQDQGSFYTGCSQGAIIERCAKMKDKQQQLVVFTLHQFNKEFPRITKGTWILCQVCRLLDSLKISYYIQLSYHIRSNYSNIVIA